MVENNISRTGKLPVRILINAKWCKKCGICITSCPKGVLVPDDLGMPVAKNADVCIQCMLCEIRCPDFAIEVEEKIKNPTKAE